MISKDQIKYSQRLLRLKSTGINPLQHDTSFYSNGQPFYSLNANGLSGLEAEYCDNPVLSSVINMKADYASNAVISVRNIKTGDIITDKDFKQSKAIDPIVKNMFRLKNNPNPLQSTKEFLTLVSIFKDVFGNSYVYGNSSVDRLNIKTIGYMWAVWPQNMTTVLNNNYFNSTEISDIIKKWEWKWGKYKKEFTVNEILHRKEPNIRLKTNDDLVLGESRQISLDWPLSNIRIAYESRNVIGKERGMRAIISSDDNDGFTGGIPMSPEEKQEVQADLKTNYGFRNGQDQFMVTRHNVSVHNVDQDVRKLGLLNEIISDAMVVCNRYGVPYNLTKMDLKGTTFENQSHDERRMYQNTTIPEENDRWEDTNIWLKCRDFGYEYIVSFDHIPILQENMKERSEINKNINAVQKEQFFAGLTTYNKWLQELKKPTIDEPWAKKRIVEMSIDEISKIKGNFTVSRQDEIKDESL